MNLILAIILGLSFGFVLQKVGAGNPQRIIDMLRLKDLHLMKAIFFGIGLSSILLFGMLSLGIINASHVGVKSAYLGVIIGGGFLGAGWTISGFCPGTGVVAAGEGRKDALFFILGGLVGAFVYMISFSSLKGTFLFNKLGGKMTLVSTGNPKFNSLLSSVPAILIAGGIAIVFMIIAWKLPNKK